MRKTLFAAGVLVSLAACRSGGERRSSGEPIGWKDGVPTEWTWMRPEAHPALVEGAYVQARTPRYMVPSVFEEHVYAGSRSRPVGTRTELAPLLRPVESKQAALDLLDLLSRVDLEGPSEAGDVRHSVVLRFDPRVPESEYPYESFRPSDAARWGIPTEPKVTATTGGFSVERPVWRRLRDDERETPGGKAIGGPGIPGVVEWVRDDVARDGTVTRSVVRVLESGPSARKHGHMMLL